MVVEVIGSFHWRAALEGATLVVAVLTLGAVLWFGRQASGQGHKIIERAGDAVRASQAAAGSAEKAADVAAEAVAIAKTTARRERLMEIGLRVRDIDSTLRMAAADQIGPRESTVKVTRSLRELETLLVPVTDRLDRCRELAGGNWDAAGRRPSRPSRRSRRPSKPYPSERPGRFVAMVGRLQDGAARGGARSRPARRGWPRSSRR